MRLETPLVQVSEEIRRRILPLKLLIFDVDGVLTDGDITYHDDGSESKTFDVKDGHGIKLLQRTGLDVALISGRYCASVEHRAKGLGIERVYQGIHRKVEAYEQIKADTGLDDPQIGYVGDDLIDIPVMRRVGFSACVGDASPHVKPFAHYVAQSPGGKGAAREICELVLQVQGRWEQVTARYFQED
ncbi:3-deoxy-D-manno-octulosonate 8-phosphate phosphatase (KDO 8-P phosphatase) [Desulfacinum hydrothermale DSM 13146]|uniref:3-deoxy-D-manno-octulosonate 8-phosphate phosphatase (KDO 8-P phosphatase) n=1 Tax=Desulfacinum hydrothermale DSM 13146 TaxID=1121390 RepID=A0A1W1XRV7_9BACT|nr:HAD-IIIA family hydrolase [Desulfacinum hydrothermale]SMC26626.1 3-deoxy-D-manno-octulosonate 8-phosphate phosphatase (KDO 8-P phosphatase) [Desulfacinum hydrothermale DSM 13146]